MAQHEKDTTTTGAAVLEGEPLMRDDVAFLREEREGPVAPANEVLSGHLEGVDEEGRLLFRAEGSDAVVAVGIGLHASDETLVAAARERRRALVTRTADRAPRMVLTGLLRERVRSEVRDADPRDLAVKMDGETLRLSAKRKIELKCGKARLTLHQNGRIELSGSYLLQRSRGPVKVKGATIHLN